MSGYSWYSATRSWWPSASGERLLVGGEDARAEAAEQPHHREIDLAVAAVDGRIDQARLAEVVARCRLPPHRSPCRRAGGSAGPHSVVQLREQALEVAAACAPTPARRRRRARSCGPRRRTR